MHGLQLLQVGGMGVGGIFIATWPEPECVAF